MNPELKAELLIATREAAAAFVEDMPHIRDVLSRPNPDRGELRRLSAVLRRLLIDNDGDLRRIAPPRTGRLVFLIPDNKAVYVADRKSPYAFFGSASVEAFGVEIRAVSVRREARPAPLNDFDPERTLAVPIDGFLGQNILNLDGQWVNRRDAIKFMSNVASGVHSGIAKDTIEKAIARIRLVMQYNLSGGAATLAFNPNAVEGPQPPFRHDPASIDPVLIEVLAASKFLAISPSIQQLEAAIRKEIA